MLDTSAFPALRYRVLFASVVVKVTSLFSRYRHSGDAVQGITALKLPFLACLTLFCNA